MVALAALLATACGGPRAGLIPRPQAAAGGEAVEGAGGSALEEVYAEVEGLEGEARRQRLAELAEEEEGTITWYTSTNLDESEPIVEAFDDALGIEPGLCRASSSDLLQRLLQEVEAGYAGPTS